MLTEHRESVLRKKTRNIRHIPMPHMDSARPNDVLNVTLKPIRMSPGSRFS